MRGLSPTGCGLSTFRRSFDNAALAPDADLRDYENVPRKEAIQAYFDREVKPHVPDAWIDREKRDPKDGEVGVVGYEISFNRYFYRYVAPRPLEVIEAEVRQLEGEIMQMLAGITGGRGEARK